MNVNIHPRRDSGHWLLAVVLLVAVAFIVYMGWKILHQMPHFDPYHGQRTNAEPDSAWAPFVEQLKAQGSNNLTVQIEGGLELPLDALAYQWNETVLTSTNLVNWSTTDLTWEQATNRVMTNHDEPMRFYNRVIFW